MAGRVTVAASIAGTAVIVSGIVGVVTVTDLGARSDNAGSRVSVAKIDVAAPSHPTPFPVTATDADIPAPAAPETVTVPAPEPREVVAPVKSRTTTTTKSEASSKSSGKGQPATGQPANGQNSNGQNANGQNSSGQNSNGGNGNQNGDNGAGKGGGNTKTELNAPVQAPTLLQRNVIIAQVPVHGNGRDTGNGRGHDKSFKTQSRESSPAHRD